MSLLSTIGGLVGLAVAGPTGAAIGAGLGTAASGGDAEDVLKNAVLGYGIGSIPGVQGFVNTGAATLGLSGMNSGAQAAGTVAGATKTASEAAAGSGGLASLLGLGKTGAEATAGVGGLAKLAENPLVMSSLLYGLGQAEGRPSALTPQQLQQLTTGERNSSFQGAQIGSLFVDSQTGKYYDTRAERDAAVRARNSFAMGGYVEGPGTGTSDSVPAQIVQNGRPVQQAALSDGEFVMTNAAVRGAGEGNRAKGAARMYELMQKFERRA
jgi:hypothetical protein